MYIARPNNYLWSKYGSNQFCRSLVLDILVLSISERINLSLDEIVLFINDKNSQWSEPACPQCHPHARLQGFWSAEFWDSIKPFPGCSLEAMVAPVMIYSNSMHLTNFGDASLWLAYVLLGLLSKYIQATSHFIFITSSSIFPFRRRFILWYGYYILNNCSIAPWLD